MMFLLKTYRVKVVSKKSRQEYLLDIQARSEKDIEPSLQDYVVQKIDKKESDLEIYLRKLFTSPVLEADILRILFFLAKALGRGVRLKKALGFLLAAEKKVSVKYFLQDMMGRLEVQFQSYYDVFKDFPQHFDHTFLGVVRAGESTGALPENILQYVEDRRKMIEQKKMIQSVLVKRGVLFSVVMLVAIVIVTFVIPRFINLFENAPNIPYTLTLLSNIATLIKSYGVLALASLGAFVFLIVFANRHSYRIKKFFDKSMVRLPLVGEVIRTYYTTNYLYFTGTLLIKNVHYIKIMDILIDQTQSIPFKEVFEVMKRNVLKGVPLQEMLKRSERDLDTNYEKVPTGYLLPSLAQALEMGAATGNMGQILYDAFLSYEVILHQKIQSTIKIFDKIFYSLVILLMGFLFFAMGTAMFALYQNAGAVL